MVEPACASAFLLPPAPAPAPCSASFPGAPSPPGVRKSRVLPLTPVRRRCGAALPGTNSPCAAGGGLRGAGACTADLRMGRSGFAAPLEPSGHVLGFAWGRLLCPSSGHGAAFMLCLWCCAAALGPSSLFVKRLLLPGLAVLPPDPGALLWQEHWWWVFSWPGTLLSWPEGWWDTDLCLWLFLLLQHRHSWWVCCPLLLHLAHILNWVLLLSCGGSWTYQSLADLFLVSRHGSGLQPHF